MEHPNAKIDYEGLAYRAIATATATSNASFGHFDLNESLLGESNMSRREAFDEIDNLLRNRFSAERHRSAPSFNPKTENYLMNFPQIDTMGNSGTGGSSSGMGGNASGGINSTSGSSGNKSSNNHTNVNLFPGSKYRIASGKINAHEYEQEFPGLGPESSKSGAAKKKAAAPTSVAAAAATMKFKPQNWQAPGVSSAASQVRKKSDLNILNIFLNKTSFVLVSQNAR